MNTLLALDRYAVRRPSSSPSSRRSPSSDVHATSGGTVPSGTATKIPSPSPLPRNRLIKTLTAQPPRASKNKTRAKRSSTGRTRKTRENGTKLVQQKGWWGASLVGVDVLWGGLWRTIFGGDTDTNPVESDTAGPKPSVKGKEKAVEPLAEKPVILNEDGTATSTTTSSSSSSSSEGETDPDTEDDGWIDPVTRAPETEEGLALQVLNADPVPPDKRSVRGRKGREVDPPPIFRLRSHSPSADEEDNVRSSQKGEQGGHVSETTRTATSSILTNPSPPRKLKREDRSEDGTPIPSSGSSPSSSKPKKLLPNPMGQGQALLTPNRPSAFDHVPTGISLTSFTSSSSFSLPNPSFTTSIFRGARSYIASPAEEKDKTRKQEHHRLEQFFHAQQARTPSITRLSTTPFYLPKTLILDLDETLIHSTSRPMNIQSSGMGGGGGLLGVSLAGLFPGSGRRGGGGGRGEGHTVEVVLGGRSTLYHVYKRPFVDHFLKKVSSWYTLVIFTASMQEYADPVIDWLDGGRGLFGKKLYRESCSAQRDGSYTKDLSLVEDDLSRVCFMDNSPVSYNWNKANALPIEGWTSDPNDEALLDMLPVLDSLRFTSDVRKVLGIRGF